VLVVHDSLTVVASVVVVVVLFSVASLGLEILSLLRCFLVVVTSAKDLKESNDGVLTAADLANAAL
jgi:hypothetical protein